MCSRTDKGGVEWQGSTAQESGKREENVGGRLEKRSSRGEGDRRNSGRVKYCGGVRAVKGGGLRTRWLSACEGSNPFPRI